MSQWINTPAEMGPIPSNSYSCTISGLDSNSVYEYRAYMIVDGVPYYGDIRQITTLDLIPATAIPLVTTGVACNVVYNAMDTCYSLVSCKNAGQINEYGILYTQNPAHATQANMVATSPNICKKSICSDIAQGEIYFTSSTCVIGNLMPNTTTYYRAFASNDCGFGYGQIKNVQTPQQPLIDIDVCLYKTQSPNQYCGIGVVTTNPSLSGTQCLIVSLEAELSVISAGSSTINIYCKPSTSGTYSSILSCTLPSSGFMQIDSPILMKPGDAICWNQCIAGSTGSYNTIRLCDILNPCGNINPSINATYCCSTVFI